MSQLSMRRPDLKGLPVMPPLPDGYRLRESRPEDREGVAALLGNAFSDPSWDAARVERELFEDSAVSKTFVVDCGGVPVATASVQLQRVNRPDTGVLHWVASDPAHRGKKLGYIVSLAVLFEFVSLGLNDAVLLTDDERLAAISTYLGLGFCPDHLDASHPARWEAVMASLRNCRS
jgi:mycothiol synthase